MNEHTLCKACAAALTWQQDYAQCAACGLWQSKLPPAILDAAAWQQLDEQARGTALKTLRHQNFALLLQRLLAVCGEQRGLLLDIGAAHGWFLAQATALGFRCQGLEPDPRLAALARQSGADIVEGFFPQALPAALRADVLVFNDVLEHIPDPLATLHACAAHLQPQGLLVLNLPLATGFFFRFATLLHKLGLSGSWQRLWQAGFPSPHLFYFTAPQLQQLATQAGLTLVSTSTLPSLTTAGLWQRLRMDRQRSLWLHALQWLLLLGLSPALRLLPSDIGLLIFRKAE
jgi:SAM-dependent methyltransferase